MKWILLALVGILIVLQIRLWHGEGSYAQSTKLSRDIQQQQAENDRLKDRNHILEVEVHDLKSGVDSAEERARNDIGMIKKNETFFLIPNKKTQQEK